MRSQNGQILTYSGAPRAAAMVANGDATAVDERNHELATRAQLAQRLAALKGFEYAGEYDPTVVYDADTLYFVPAETLLHSHAAELGIRRENQLLGGSVAEPFTATKSITHRLVGAEAAAPIGWTGGFAEAVSKVVLPGFSVFSRKDARRAALKLLESGPVRLKPALGVGGCGQCVIEHLDELDAALAAIDADEMALYGAVIERNLHQVLTYSVGQVHVDGMRIAYYGMQRMTTNHQGQMVYGGSTLHVVRGDFNTLKQLEMAPEVRLAVEQACRYNNAANVFLPGFFASRRNYDVAQGVDGEGRPYSGVLEQSWRIGGATPAEVAALEAFTTDPTLKAVQATSCEVYSGKAPPASARVYFRGIDPHLGSLAKYSTIDTYEYPTD